MKYDIKHLERMWRVYSYIREIQMFEKRGELNNRITWDDLQSRINKKIDASYSPEKAKALKNVEFDLYKESCEKELPDEYKQEVKSLIGEKNLPKFFKPIIAYYSPNDFLKAYSLLSEANKGVVENVICSSLVSVPSAEPFLAKNLHLILDAFCVPASKVDARMSARQAITKLLSKHTRMTNADGRIFEICEKINEVVLEAILEHHGENEFYLPENFEDTKFRDAFFAPTSDETIESPLLSYAFYIEYPFTEEDLYHGRIKYNGTDKYSDYNNDWLAQSFKELKPLEKSMIYNLIYELIYSEYKDMQKRRYLHFKQSAPSITKQYFARNKILTPKEYDLNYISNLIIDNVIQRNNMNDEEKTD